MDIFVQNFGQDLHGHNEEKKCNVNSGIEMMWYTYMRVTYDGLNYNFYDLFWAFFLIHKANFNLYPFHIAKFATGLIHPLCCCYTPVRFGLLSHRASDPILESFKKRSKIEQKEYHPNALFGLSLRIIRCTLSHWQPHRRRLQLFRIRFQNTLIHSCK